MKNFLFPAIMLLAVVFANAQNNNGQKSTAQKAEPVYYCVTPDCPVTSHASGSCPDHHTPMLLQGSFYCSVHTDVTSDKPMHCSKCHIDMVQLDRQKRAPKK